jgi:hypothetical protein
MTQKRENGSIHVRHARTARDCGSYVQSTTHSLGEKSLRKRNLLFLWAWECHLISDTVVEPNVK